MAEPGASPEQIIAQRLGAQPPRTDDPAFAVPRDALAGAAGEALKGSAGVWQRDNPIVTINTGWTPALIRQAFHALVAGIFDPASQLIDSLIGDSRVMAGLDSRIGGLLGRPVDFIIPKRYRDSAAAKECRDAFYEAWPTLAAEPVLAQLETWAILLGHGHAQQAWDTSGRYAIPHPRIWHPRYTYYDWTNRRIVAITQDGQTPIEGGDGHWIEHAPHGVYRGWMRGAVRAIAPWWLGRNYALTDAMRWSEANGQPMVKAKHPASADRVMVANFCATLANRGAHTTVELPQGIPEAGQSSGDNANFDVEYLEAGGIGFDGFFKLIDACNQEINLALQAQTLATSIGPEGRGSYAAARVHADTRQALIEADARNLARTIYTQIARPFAFMNFDDPDLAPLVEWNVEPYEDAQTKAATLLSVTQALVNLANAGHKVMDPEVFARQFGVKLGRLEDIALPTKPAMSGSGERARFAPAANVGTRLRVALQGASRIELREAYEALAEIEAGLEAERPRQRRKR